MSERNFEADLALCNTASPGPWHPDTDRLEDGSETWTGKIYTDIDRDDDVPGKCWCTYEDTAQGVVNIRFACTAREGWPASLREVLRLRAEVERLKAMVKLVERGRPS